MTDRPPPDSCRPSPPPPVQLPPKVDLKLLWISLLLPMGSSLFALLLGYASTADFGLMLLIMVMSVVFGWIIFHSAIRDRLRGRSIVILLCAYPLVQVFASAATFFFGCLGLLSIHA